MYFSVPLCWVQGKSLSITSIRYGYAALEVIGLTNNIRTQVLLLQR